jgi:hypothetical protein
MAQVTVLETYPQLLNFDPEVFDYFKEQCVPRLHLLSYILTFTQTQSTSLHLGREPYVSAEGFNPNYSPSRSACSWRAL